jgi:hypothetical protein
LARAGYHGKIIKIGRGEVVAVLIHGEVHPKAFVDTQFVFADFGFKLHLCRHSRDGEKYKCKVDEQFHELNIS